MNFIVERSIGKVFTAGRNMDDLQKEMDFFRDKNIFSVADLSIEGVEKGPKEVLEYNKEETMGILRAVATDARHSMALKVTAMTYIEVLKDLNVVQKKLYDMFVDIAGYDLKASITKAQVLVGPVTPMAGQGIPSSEARI